jgi:hypothetical protein
MRGIKIIWTILIIPFSIVSCSDMDNEKNVSRNYPKSFDQEVKISLHRKSKKNTSIDWDKIYFTSDNYSDTAKMRPLIGDSKIIEVKFNKEHFYEKNYRVFFTPYAEDVYGKVIRYELADYLNILHPEISSAQINFTSRNGLYLMESDIDKYLLERNVISSSFPFSICFDLNNANCQGVDSRDSLTQIIVLNKLAQTLNSGSTSDLQHLFDFEEMSKFMILQSLLMNDPRTSEMNFYYSYTDGKVHPIYRENKESYENESDLDLKSNIITLLLRNSEFKDEYYVLLDSLRIMKDSLENSILESLTSKNLVFVDDSIKQKTSSMLGMLTPRNQSLMSWLELPKNKSELYLKSFDKNRNKGLRGLNYLKDSIGIVIEDKKIIFKAGNSFRIKRSVIIPFGYQIVIEEGVTINMSKDVSFLSYSPLDINGTINQPVFIQALIRNEPFGSFGFIGSEKETCHISYLTVEGGFESRINDVLLSGAFCLYHTNVEMKNSTISNNLADDGLNIKYGNVLIENCVFKENFADQVDLDFCTGKVVACSFDNNEGDSNGDGLDVSGSNLDIVNCTFNKFDDKGISTGEYSLLNVSHCRFEDNNNAIAVKDLSIVHLDSSVFTRNQTVTSLYQKKQIFGGGTLNYTKANQFIENVNMFILDSLSKTNLVP